MQKIRALALATVMTAVASSADAATFLSVGPDSLCGSGGCLSESRRSFSQTFSPGTGGLKGVSALAFSRGIVGDMQHHAVRISFELADGTVIDWGKFVVGVLGGDVVTLRGQSFDWDGALGELTVRVELLLPQAGGGGGFAGFGGSPVSLAPPAFSPLPDSVVGFPAARPSLPGAGFLATAVPEPDAWAAMILGFGGAGAMLRNRRRSPQSG
ncbi:PEPxxWA-CTERM sorting domain-containing protein [Phenylobacterium sp.]|uniref:PEPxxWA-CTERM sorting domain-containing protein n=1 Tax=Phenylobacterium sp. TaxID=1871053 RepID=UPI00301D03E0